MYKHQKSHVEVMEVLVAYMGEVVWPHHSRPNGKASMGIGPMWRHSCLVWPWWLFCCFGNAMINLKLYLYK